MSAFDDRAELDELQRRLDDHAESLCRQFYGAPTSRRGHQLRWGKRGSFLLRLDGRRGARWTDFEAQTGGDMLALIVREQVGIDFAEAIRWARGWLGDEPSVRSTRARPREKAVDFDDQQAAKRRQVVDLLAAGGAIEGTLGARYLCEHRGINREAWPPSVVRLVAAHEVKRIIPAWACWWRWPALIFAATDAGGTVTGVQLVALQPDGQAVLRDEGGKLKLSYGRLAGAAVRWPGVGDDGPLLLVEGGETAASLWHATGLETWANLGSISKAPLDGVPLSRVIIICADDDARNAPANRPLNQAIRRWRSEGRRVLLVKPWRLSRRDKSDFNDLLLIGGIEAVRARVLDALEAVRASTAPGHQPLEIARERCVTAINSAIDELLGRQPPAPPAPFKVAMIAVGIGKTEAAVRRIVFAAVRGARITYLVPTHKLGGEVVDRVKAEVLRQGVEIAVDVWRGRPAERPDAPGQTMCAELEVVGDAQTAKLNVAQTVCVMCPRAPECPYLAQSRRSAAIWIGAHELLFHEMPVPMRGSDLVVIDEGFALHAGVVGTSGMPILLTIDEIETVPSMRMTPSLRTRRRAPRRDKDGREFRRPGAGAAADVVAELMPLRRKLAAALANHPDGGLDRQRLLDAGLTANDAAKAAGIEWRILDRDAILGVSTWEGLRAEIHQAAINARGIDRRVMAWQVVADLLGDVGAARSGRAMWGEQEAAGVTFRALRLFGLQPIAKGWCSTPTMHIDGTVNMTLLRTRVPHAELIVTIEANAPAMSVRQIVGKTFGKGALADEKTLARAWDWSVAYASRRGGDWLVILPKAAESLVTAAAAPPTFVKTAHFGNLRGLDQHRRVAGLIVIGRPMPPPTDVERIAGVLTGREIEQPVEGWYPSEVVHLAGRDGTVATVEADRHPDEIAEAVRSAICQDELLQAVGRARGASRTAANPVEVILLGNVPVPWLVPDTIEQWRTPGVDDEILARHGVVLEAAAHAAKVAGLTTKALEHRRASLPPFS
jgi:putative DNA primase/helicase